MYVRSMNDLRRLVASATLLGLLFPTGLALAPISLAEPGPGECSLADLLACAEENAASPPGGSSDVPGGNTDGSDVPGGNTDGGSNTFLPATGGPPEVGMQVGGSNSFLPATGGPPEIGAPLG